MSDTWKEMMIHQGYVPKKCQLNGKIIWGLINRSEDPCAGCNVPRNECGGRPADPDYMQKARERNSEEAQDAQATNSG